MKYLIRLTTVFGFLSLTIFFASCGASSAEKQFSGDASKPMVTPRITTGRPKIIAFGDSLTAGFGLAEKESYPYLLQKKLETEGYNYEVVNAGISGETSLGGLERVDWVLEQDNVSIVVLELGANDLLRGLPVAKMKDNLARIIKKAKAKKITVLLCGMLAPPSVGAQYQREYTNAFPDLASEHKVAFLPFLLENVALNKDLNQADGIHPNARGAVVMTNNIHKALLPLLKK